MGLFKQHIEDANLVAYTEQQAAELAVEKPEIAALLLLAYGNASTIEDAEKIGSTIEFSLNEALDNLIFKRR
jgi:hypothetical protein